MNSPVDKIKERLSIVDVISSYIPLLESGKNYKAKCPFHNEKTPSFYVSPDRNSFYCFGCSAKGDIFTFVEKFEGTDFRGALRLLAERAGVPLTVASFEGRDNKDRYYEIMEEATQFFQLQLEKEPSARAYLHERGLLDATISSFRVGFAPDSWRSVSEYLIEKGYKKEDLETVGLIKTSDKGFYDRFRSRIMFPITDSASRVIAFSGRIFGQEVSTDTPTNVGASVGAKYLNSPDTPLFNKSNVLFGIDKAKHAIRTRGYSIVVEGQMDLLLSHQAEFTNTVAVSGTAFADSTVDTEDKINNLGLVKRLSSNIIFAFDGDSAGIRACSRAAFIALSLDMQVKIAVLPEGKDPADIIHEDSSIWKEIIKNSVNIVSFHIDRICKSTTDMRIRGKQIRDIVFPFLSRVKSAIERSAYISEIHSKTSISEQALREDFESYERLHPNEKVDLSINTEKKDILISRYDALSHRLYSIVFWQKNGEFGQDINTLMDAFKESIGNDLYQELLSTHDPYMDTLSFEAEMWYGGKHDTILRDFQEILLSLEEEILKKRKADLGPIDTDEKLSLFNTIVKRIEEIKHLRSQ